MRIHEVWLHVKIQSLVEKDTEIRKEKKRGNAVAVAVVSPGHGCWPRAKEELGWAQETLYSAKARTLITAKMMD